MEVCVRKLGLGAVSDSVRLNMLGMEKKVK